VLSLAEALAALPTTADDIAAHLHAKGIRGLRRRAGCCPVANYLVGAGFDEATVGPTEIHAWTEGSGELESVTPWWLTDFIVRFDEGDFPELVLDDTAEPDQTESTTTPLER
jgi:hypothetical protein